MSNNYTEKSCQICHSYLFEEDDVVVCPICGAPHHRTCYNSVGHCGLEVNHNTELQYDRVKEKEQESDSHLDANDANAVCKSCKKSISGDGIFCPYCGTDRNSAESQSNNSTNGSIPQFKGAPFNPVSFGTPFFDPYGGVPKDEKIDDVPVEDVKNFVMVNTQRYIPKFRAISEKKRISWNWAAFLLPEGWCFFRKNYIAGYITIVITIISTLLSIPLANEMSSIISNMPIGNNTSNYQVMMAFAQNIGSVSNFALITSTIGVMIGLVKMIVFGMLGDYFYKGHVINKIKQIKGNNAIDDKSLAFAKWGGTNIFLLFIVFIFKNWLPAILAIIL